MKYNTAIAARDTQENSSIEPDGELLAVSSEAYRRFPANGNRRQSYVMGYLREKNDLTYRIMEKNNRKGLVRAISEMLWRAEAAMREAEVYTPPPPTKAYVIKVEKCKEVQAARTEASNRAMRDMMVKFDDLHRAKAIVDAWMLHDGVTSLLSADQATLEREIAVENSLVSEHSRKRQFYLRILNVLPPGAVVRDGVSMADLSEIHGEVFAALPPL